MAVVSKQDKWGRYRAPTAGAETSFDTVAAGTVRLSVLQDLPRAMWVRGIGIWAGRSTGTAATMPLAMYQTDQNKEPADLGGDDTRMGYAESVSVNTSMVNTSGGAQYELDFAQIDYGPGTVSVLLPAGYRPAIGPLPTVATLGVSYEPSEIDGEPNTKLRFDNLHWYEKLGLTQPPPLNVDGIVDQGELGVMTVWIYGEYNEAPQTPVNRTVLNLDSLTPTFQWSFRDNNGRWGGPSQNNSGSNVGDRVNRVHVQVRRASDRQSFWSFVRTATQDERDADQPQVVYAGDVLSRNVPMQWRVRHEDFAGAWSEFSDWLGFTVDNFGTITLDGAPQSTIQQITGITFNGKWTHTAALATNAVQIQLLTQSNDLIEESPIIAKTVASSAAPGTAFTIAPIAITSSSVAAATVITTGAAHGLTTGDEIYIKGHSGSTPVLNNVTTPYPVTVLSSTTFSIPVTVSVGGTGGTVEVFADLEWTNTYKYRIRGRDTSNNWSNYSARRQFRTNAAPTIPTDLRPDGGNYTDLPFVSCICTDADDTPGTGFIVTVEFTRPNASTVTAALTYNAVTERWEFQATTTELNAFGTYSMRCRGYDGTAYSGGLSSSLAWSPPVTFAYLTGPTVTITSPTEGQVIGTTSLHVAWTSSTTQLDFQDEQIVDVATGKRVHPPPDDIFHAAVERPEQEFDVPAGRLLHEHDYALSFTYIDAGGFWEIQPRHFSVLYTPPADVSGLSVLTKGIGDDPWDTVILVSHDQTLLGTAFGGYQYYRAPVDAPADDDVLMATNTNSTDTFWYDANPVSGIEYRYTVRQVEHKDSGEDILSAGVSSSAMVTLRGTVLTSVTDISRRVVLYNIRERGDRLNTRQKTYDVVSGGAPITVQSPTVYLSQPITAWLIANPEQGLQGADATYQALLDLAGAPRNGVGPEVVLSAPSGTMSLRDERQRLRYVTIESLEGQDRRQPRYEVNLTVRDSRWTPKVEVR